MTIEQERDIAVRALERIISDYKNAYLGHLDAKNVAEEALAAIKRAQALQALIDQAQDLDMGYGAAQASPVAPTIKDRLMVADDAITAFEDRYKRDANDPSCAESLRVWCDAWKVKSDSTCNEFLQVAEESPVGAFCLDCGKRNLGIHTCSPQYAAQPVGEAVAWAVEANIGDGLRCLTKVSTVEVEIDKWVSAHQAEYSGAQRAKVALYRSAPPVAQDQDAARYRWLRDVSEPGICSFYLAVGKAFHGVRFKPETVDSAIDTAMLAEVKS